MCLYTYNIERLCLSGLQYNCHICVKTLKTFNFLYIFQLELFLKNQMNVFSPFFLQSLVRADERKIVMYDMTHGSIGKSMKKKKNQ